MSCEDNGHSSLRQWDQQVTLISKKVCKRTYRVDSTPHSTWSSNLRTRDKNLHRRHYTTSPHTGGIFLLLHRLHHFCLPSSGETWSCLLKFASSSHARQHHETFECLSPMHAKKRTNPVVNEGMLLLIMLLYLHRKNPCIQKYRLFYIEFEFAKILYWGLSYYRCLAVTAFCEEICGRYRRPYPSTFIWNLSWSLSRSLLDQNTPHTLRHLDK